MHQMRELPRTVRQTWSGPRVVRLGNLAERPRINRQHLCPNRARRCGSLLDTAQTGRDLPHDQIPRKLGDQISVHRVQRSSVSQGHSHDLVDLEAGQARRIR